MKMIKLTSAANNIEAWFNFNFLIYICPNTQEPEFATLRFSGDPELYTVKESVFEVMQKVTSKGWTLAPSI